MKTTALFLSLVTSLSLFAFSGTVEVKSDWNSFSTWYVVFENDEIVTSYTDGLDAEDFNAVVSQDGDHYQILSHVIASDAFLGYGLVLEIYKDQPYLQYAYEFEIDANGDYQFMADRREKATLLIAQ